MTNPSALGALLAVAQQSVVIDSGWDLLGFAQEAADIAKGDIAFVTIPTAGAENNSRGDVVLVDSGVVREFVDQKVEAQDAAAAEAARRAARPGQGRTP